VNKLTRSTGVIDYSGDKPSKKIPYFVVGYKGWANINTATGRLRAVNNGQVIINGVLQINPCFFVGEGPFANHQFEGAAGLFGFLLSIEHLTSSMLAAKPPFLGYVK
jgi:hypothetical protein